MANNNHNNDSPFEFEHFEGYFGGTCQVEKIMNDCPQCGAKLIQTHFSNYSHFYVQENSHCPECHEGTRQVIHVLN